MTYTRSLSSPSLLNTVYTKHTEQPRKVLEKENRVSTDETVKIFEELTLEEQVDNIIQEQMHSAEFQMPLDKSHPEFKLILKFIKINIIENKQNKKITKKISKAIYKNLKAADITPIVHDLLNNCFELLKRTDASLGLSKIIDKTTTPGFQKTCKTHLIVVNEFLVPLILNAPLKGSNSAKTEIVTRRSTETIQQLHCLFSTSALQSSDKIDKSLLNPYKHIMDLLAPVTPNETDVLSKNKIPLKQIVKDRRLFLDMREKLSIDHKEELFIFVDQLLSAKSKQDFYQLIKATEINITSEDRNQLQNMIEEAFTKPNLCPNELIESIINLVSQQVSTMWLGMLYDYSEIIDSKENRA